MSADKYPSVEEYIRAIPPKCLERTLELRHIIKSALPEAEEVISYNMPAYKYRKILVYFAVYNSHIGFYPTPSAIAAFKDDLSSYKCAKGTIQFPYDTALPKTLIQKICRFRLEEIQLHT